MEYTKIGVPLFDGHNYSFWGRRMKTYIQAQEFDFWQEIVDGYTTPTTIPTDIHGKKLSEKNSKTTNAILNGLYHSIYVKFMHCDFAKDIWEKL
jgi:hypothetical protein